MHFSAVTLLLPLTALASPFLIDTRAAKDLSAAIMKNLTQTNTDSITLNNTLNSFGDDSEPSFFQALALQQQGDQIETDLTQTTGNANKTAVLTAAESTKIYNQLKNTLLPTTTQVLNNFIAHYPGLNEQGLASAVNSSLVQQRNSVEILAKALTAKSSGSAKTNGPALTNQFVAAFNKAIAVYSQ